MYSYLFGMATSTEPEAENASPENPTSPTRKAGALDEEDEMDLQYDDPSLYVVVKDGQIIGYIRQNDCLEALEQRILAETRVRHLGAAVHSVPRPYGFAVVAETPSVFGFRRSQICSLEFVPVRNIEDCIISSMKT